MDDQLKEYLLQKYGQDLGSINQAQAFSNLGDVIAGQKVGSSMPYYTEQRKLAEGTSLGELARQENLDLKKQAIEDKKIEQENNRLMRQLALQQQGQIARENLDVKKLMAQSNIDLKKQKAEELNQYQSKQLGLVRMGSEANKQYEDTVKAGYNPTDYKNQLDFVEGAPQFVKSDLGKKARAAENNWVEAYLRDASGAAIAVSERAAYARDFFPRPGDTPEIIQNKSALRKIKEENAIVGAGKGANMLPQQQPQQQLPQQNYPKKLFKNGKSVTVKSAKEENEAGLEGWK